MTIARLFYHSALWNFVEKLSLYLSGLVLSMLLTRSLTPEAYGAYSSVMSVAALVPLLMSMGLDRAMMVEGARLGTHPESKGRLVYLVRQLLAYRVALTVVVCAAMWLSAPLLARWLHQPQAASSIALLALYTASIAVGQLFRSLFIGVLRVPVIGLVRVGTDLATLLLAVIALDRGWGVSGVIGAFALANIGAVTAFAVASRRYVGGRAERFDLQGVYRLSAVAWVVAVMALLLGKHVDVFLMALFGVPSREIGFYTLGVNLYLLGGFFAVGSGPIAQAIFARVAAQRREGLAATWTATVKLLSLVTLPVFVFIIGYARAFISVLYTEAFAGAALYFWIYAALLMVHAILGASYCDPLFYATGQERFVLIFQIGAGLLNLALDCLLIPLWGGLGACVATGTAYVSLGIVQTLAAHRFFGVRPPMAFQARLLLASGTALGASLLWPGAGQGWTGLAIRGGCYGVSLMGLLYALKPVDACDVESARRVNPLVYQLARLFGRASPVPS